MSTFIDALEPDHLGHDFRRPVAKIPLGMAGTPTAAATCTRCELTIFDTPTLEGNLGPCRECPQCAAGTKRADGTCPTCEEPAEQPGEDLSKGEHLGVLVAGTIHLIETERDAALNHAVEMREALAVAAAHIGAMAALIRLSGTTWAADTRTVEQAEAFVTGLDLPKTPDTPQETT